MTYKVVYGNSTTNVKPLTREFDNRMEAELFASTKEWFNLYRKSQNETCIWLKGQSSGKLK